MLPHQRRAHHRSEPRADLERHGDLDAAYPPGVSLFSGRNHPYHRCRLRSHAARADGAGGRFALSAAACVGAVPRTVSHQQRDASPVVGVGRGTRQSRVVALARRVCLLHLSRLRPLLRRRRRLGAGRRRAVVGAARRDVQAAAVAHDARRRHQHRRRRHRHRQVWQRHLECALRRFRGRTRRSSFHGKHRQPYRHRSVAHRKSPL